MNDSVFREGPDGRLLFVGDFETVYRNNPDPWEQSGDTNSAMARYYAHSRARLLSVIRKHNLPRQACGIEIGCGHGHVTHMLSKSFLDHTWWGMDISEAAVHKARLLYPDDKLGHYKFVVGNIRQRMSPALRPFLGDMHVVVLNQLLWYILDDLDIVMANASNLLDRGGGLLVFSQAFLRNQRYGCALIDGFPGLLEFMSLYDDKYRLIYASYDDTQQHCHHDGVVVYRKL